MPGGDRRRSWWGWGWEDEALDRAQIAKLAGALSERFGLADLPVADPPDLDDLALREPRISPPASLSSSCSQAVYDRAGHTYGKSYRDVVRGLRGDLPHPPDVVAFPRSEDEVVELLDWCASNGIAAIPYGGGSSVVGGVECDVGDGYSGVVSIDLGQIGRAHV